MLDALVIGGGQAGLAVGYHLRRHGLRFLVLDAARHPGGAWRGFWPSLRLFSPASHSSLPGRPMPGTPGEPYPRAGHVVEYLTAYERRYDLPVRRPVTVRAVRRVADGLAVETDDGSGAGLDTGGEPGTLVARAVISATGTWSRPFVPALPGRDRYRGRLLHTVDYRGPEEFAGRRVVVVGGGNSGAQIAADLAPHARTLWVTRRPPRFLPDDIDGRALFDTATARRRALEAGRPDPGGVAALGDVVATEAVREAREQGTLTALPMFDRLEPEGPRWADGTVRPADAIILCTGFRPALAHLAPLRPRRARGRIPVEGTRSVDEPRLFLLGYGDWTGPASATLIGVGRPARETAAAVADLPDVRAARESRARAG
ncbi:ArsO family NAD(P)H-dependent flavin-containing monooxygenase [Streptomyces sp. ST2-7A]|uniref:ArsO family NAD(P)H-dependent flavin-containing monooxygenase n=1 Tax=Streptomyces sp. ST2-7A TaxID=2907214 RepID=UPI001F47BD4C|nr:ArsO family NAD(P)H-dependent flavin-containing monooxygenase [Streptomyces sp. ST2-7A]MCE7079088.1 ArsO family NAD(P)H-dependent flavin-containing monooxygenase [Streptomyces sp. ST2-7A]